MRHNERFRHNVGHTKFFVLSTGQIYRAVWGRKRRSHPDNSRHASYAVCFGRRSETSERKRFLSWLISQAIRKVSCQFVSLTLARLRALPNVDIILHLNYNKNLSAAVCQRDNLFKMYVFIMIIISYSLRDSRCRAENQSAIIMMESSLHHQRYDTQFVSVQTFFIAVGVSGGKHIS